MTVQAIWRGKLRSGGDGLLLQLRVQGEASRLTATLDSLDQGAMAIPCTGVRLEGDVLSLEVPAVGGRLRGTLSADGQTLESRWSQQGAELVVSFRREAKAIERAAVADDPALPPASLAELDAIMHRDLAPQVARGVLAPRTGIGVVIGVSSQGQRLVKAYGAVKEDSVFEIGSITKTFTGLLLAQMVAQKRVRLDEPVSALLPPGTAGAPATGDEITLVDLSAQRSGLPRMPDNFAPADPTNPYVDYDDKALFAYLAKRGLAREAGARPVYSNLGLGLLGAALARRGGASYEQLVRREILVPLAMHDTGITLAPAQQERFVSGHDAKLAEAHAWDLAALAGAGALRSTAADMLAFLEAQLHPDQLSVSARSTPAGRTLPAALTASHQPHGEFAPGVGIALNWLYGEKSRTFWHNGATGGYSSFASFDQDKDLAIVVLANVTEVSGAIVDRIAGHVRSRILGEPSISLAPSPRDGD